MLLLPLRLKPDESSKIGSPVKNLAAFLTRWTRLEQVNAIKLIPRVISGEIIKSCAIDLVNLAAHESF